MLLHHLERATKETGDGSQLSVVLALLVGNEGRLLVQECLKRVLSEYKGKANTRYNLVKNKVFESVSDAIQVITEL